MRIDRAAEDNSMVLITRSASTLSPLTRKNGKRGPTTTPPRSVTSVASIQNGQPSENPDSWQGDMKAGSFLPIRPADGFTNPIPGHELTPTDLPTRNYAVNPLNIQQFGCALTVP